MKDYSEEVRDLINKYKDCGFEYGKSVSYLEFRNGCSIEEMEKEIIELNQLKFVDKQIKGIENRYALYFVYSNKSGRTYVLTFKNKIRIITAYPLGPSTFRLYKRKFKK